MLNESATGTTIRKFLEIWNPFCRIGKREQRRKREENEVKRTARHLDNIWVTKLDREMSSLLYIGVVADL